MSAPTEQQKDTDLKLRTMQYLWNLGYYVRRNVPLTESWTKSEQTDIDVLGVKVDEEFMSDFIVSDCKSGASDGTKTRLFWLSGVMKYFGSRRGIFVRTQMLGTKYIELADTLGIIPLSESQLTELEHSYSRGASKSIGPFSRDYAKADEFLGRLKQSDKEAYEYVRIKYWADTPHQQILSLFPKAKRVSSQDIDDEAQVFQLAYMLSLLSLSIVRLARTLSSVPPPQREEAAQLSLLGGRIGYQERTELLQGFYDFMSREIQKRYKEKYPVSRKEFVENVVPPFAKYLADLVVRLCQFPRAAISLPRLMDLTAYEVILRKDVSGVHDVRTQYPGLTVPEISRVGKDFAAFVERSGLGNPPFNHALESAITKLEG